MACICWSIRWTPCGVAVRDSCGGRAQSFRLGQERHIAQLGLSPDDFVILLTHTPDYAEDVPVTNSDLILAGHTHGGQVTLFGLYAPIVPSHYGQRFLPG